MGDGGLGEMAGVGCRDLGVVGSGAGEGVWSPQLKFCSTHAIDLLPRLWLLHLFFQDIFWGLMQIP